MSIAPNDTYLKPVGSFLQQSAVQGPYDASVNISAEGPRILSSSERVRDRKVEDGANKRQNRFQLLELNNPG